MYIYRNLGFGGCPPPSPSHFLIRSPSLSPTPTQIRVRQGPRRRRHEAPAVARGEVREKPTTAQGVRGGARRATRGEQQREASVAVRGEPRDASAAARGASGGARRAARGEPRSTCSPSPASSSPASLRSASSSSSTRTRPTAAPSNSDVGPSGGGAPPSRSHTARRGQHGSGGRGADPCWGDAVASSSSGVAVCAVTSSSSGLAAMWWAVDGLSGPMDGFAGLVHAFCFFVF